MTATVISTKNIEEYQAKLDAKREELRGSEHWEYIKDDRKLKMASPKCIAYRKSPSYQYMKMLRQEIDGNKCVKCGCKDNLELHHLTYERLFGELLTDVITLCRKDHVASDTARKEIWGRKNQSVFHEPNVEKTMNSTDNTNTRKKTIKLLKKNKEIMGRWLCYHIEDVSRGEKDSTKKADAKFGEEMKISAAAFRTLRKQCGINGPNKPVMVNGEKKDRNLINLIPIVAFTKRMIASYPNITSKDIKVQVEDKFEDIFSELSLESTESNGKMPISMPEVKTQLPKEENSIQGIDLEVLIECLKKHGGEATVTHIKFS